jgi:hypothetical protein
MMGFAAAQAILQLGAMADYDATSLSATPQQSQQK